MKTMTSILLKEVIWLFISQLAATATLRSTLAILSSSSNTNFPKMESKLDVGENRLGNPNILITGGAGYIGTHTIVVLLEAGYDVTVVDSLVNSNEESLRRVRRISNCADHRIQFFKVDLCDSEALEDVFKSSPKFDACIHFAGLKAVGESVQKPLLYYQNNLLSTINLLNLLNKYNCTSIIFSSSATVYGSAEVRIQIGSTWVIMYNEHQQVPITESTPTGTGITNPYGRTKYMIEEILMVIYLCLWFCTHVSNLIPLCIFI